MSCVASECTKLFDHVQACLSCPNSVYVLVDAMNVECMHAASMALRNSRHLQNQTKQITLHRSYSYVHSLVAAKCTQSVLFLVFR